jgi:hypothetical protein
VKRGEVPETESRSAAVSLAQAVRTATVFARLEDAVSVAADRRCGARFEGGVDGDCRGGPGAALAAFHVGDEGRAAVEGHDERPVVRE